MLQLLNENQLDEWVRANAEDAKGVIVDLIRRLVSTSCPQHQEYRFPAPDSIGQHGPDGMLEDEDGFEPYIPKGRSYWQFGTGSRPGKKATDDYTALTTEDGVPEAIRKSSTFVFVTPLSARTSWEYTWKPDAQATWIEKRTVKNEWKGVRVIDGTKLVEWLHRFPVEEIWLAQRTLGIPSREIEIPELHWNIVQSIGEPPPLLPEIFLCDREDALAKLKEVFEDRLVKLKITTHFPAQVADVVSAYIASLVPHNQPDLAGRCLIVSGSDAWNAICDHKVPHILIASNPLDLNDDAGTKLIQKARRAGHAVIFAGPPGGIPDPGSIPLSTPRPSQVEAALKSSGYSEERARTLANKCAGNLSSLLRCIQNLSDLPEWAQSTDAAELSIASILGSWNEGNASDRTVIEGLSGNVYGEWIAIMRDVALRPATPLVHRNGIWRFIPRFEGWYALGPRLYDEHVRRLVDAAFDVLQENDPQFELKETERFAASIHGKVLRHSTQLRKGLADSLALLGSHSNALISCSQGNALEAARLAVRRLLSGEGWIRWASLNDLLPLLAEASPTEFLDAVEKSLRRIPCPFDEMFAQEGDGLMGRTYMSGVLWALETLAWSDEYLFRVVTCLGYLAQRDPGGKWANRPSNSLSTILLPWFPQTCASVAKRISALKSLLVEIPEVGWTLLTSLALESQTMSSGSRRPVWRKLIPDDWGRTVKESEYWEQIATYSDIAVAEAERVPSRLPVLVRHMEQLYRPAFDRLLNHLMSEAVRNLPATEVLPVVTELVDCVTRHRKYSNAEWALDPEQVNRIANVAEALGPRDPFYCHQRLFSDRDFDLFERNADFDLQAKELELRRQMAVREIHAAGDLELVVRFASAVQSAWRVGFAMGSNVDESVVAGILPRYLNANEESIRQFAGGFVWKRFELGGWDWADRFQLGSWTPADVGQFLAFLPFGVDTWKRAHRYLGEDESPYWIRTSANPYEVEGAELQNAVEMLLQCGRRRAAIQCLRRMVDMKTLIDPSIAVKALLGVTGTDVPDYHDTVKVITALQNDPNADMTDVMRVEMAYLSILDGHHGGRPKFLEHRLAEDPSFFCEAIRSVFRSRTLERSNELSGDDAKVNAAHVYTLLRKWHTPPGLSGNGQPFDGEKLKKWLAATTAECSSTGHLDVALTMLGHVLNYVPADPDGLWIHRSAAEVLNARDSDEIRNGFATELYNSRGVHWVDPTGNAEKELAARYRSRADLVELAGFGRIASTLRDLAERYDREAERIASSEQFSEMTE